MANKASAQPTKPAAVAPKSAPAKPGVATSAAAAAAAAAAAKMHKRSRSGCFTCRLRRKKCDEGKPACKACKHLGLKCEYKRPLWWSNNEQRKQHKEMIKNVIKRTKLSEKSAKHADSTDNAGRNRAASEDSDYSFDFNAAPAMAPGSYDMYNLQVYTPGFEAHHPHAAHPAYAPYEVDIHTERQMYIDDVPTRKDSTHSTYSTFQPPPHGNLAPVPEDEWPVENIYDTPGDMFAESKEGVDYGFFDFQHAALPAAGEAEVEVEECDRPLLEHFIGNVLPLIFPILELHQPGSARSEVVLPALESNKCYLHCCLSIAAIHLKSSLPEGTVNEQLDSDIVRHRYATISELCTALNRDEDHSQILEATLGMIFFQCSVGRTDDSLPDIPWHQHFQAATNLVRKLDLPAIVENMSTPAMHPPFNMTLAAWIDILGATMLGTAPQFANTYREMHLSGKPLGLLELMGCEDRTMCLISEVACLDALKLTQALDHTALCSHIALLGQQMDNADVPASELESAVDAEGAVRPRHLARNMTQLFLKAARIWLVGMVPGAEREAPALLSLQQQFVELLGFLPTGPGGYDRCVVWPLLMAGVHSTRDGAFRAALADRVATMGPAADTGSLGRVRRVLEEVWAVQEEMERQGATAPEGMTCWRDVMRAHGWDFLLL